MTEPDPPASVATERFLVMRSDAMNASIERAVGTIVDDDGVD